MEKITIFSGKASYERLQSANALSDEMKRFKFYNKTIFQERFGTKKETDTHIYWSVCSYTPRFENNRLFFTMKDKEGFTYDKKKNVLSAWWSRPIGKTDPNMIDDIINHFKCEWFFSLPTGLRSTLTIPLLKRIVKKKITNPADYVKSYLKVSPYRNLNISPKLLIDFFSSTTNNAFQYMSNIKSMRMFLEYSTDANHVFKMINLISKNHDYNTFITDIYNQAAMLNTRINPQWSKSRMKEEHNIMTRKIMEIEIKNLEKIEYNYPDTFDNIKLNSLTLIQDNYKLFEEGTIMKHCVYTNYKSQVENKNYFVLQYLSGDVRATVGLIVDRVDNKYVICMQQMYGIGNSLISIEHKKIVEEWLLQPEVQEYFLNIYNYSKINIKDTIANQDFLNEYVQVGIH